MSLFDYQQRKSIMEHAPLAARMRPRVLDEFWGQSHILAPGRLLRRAIEADQLSSLIFYGPPGTGKTTLARIIANTTHAKFISINAVLAGVKEIRDAIEQAKQSLALSQRKCVLFVDEVHRFNKSQQDALLPWVENGTLTLIGATTENPFFEVNKALLSRSRVFQLKSLSKTDLRAIAYQALTDEERGYGLLSINIDSDAMEHLLNVANGDARALLNALELAVSTSEPNEEGLIHIDLEVAEESIQQRAVLYDKEGDAHFDTISAFIKSVRGSDPDAALYWLARMVLAGESPNFIFRRLLILACEDIGLADPHAVAVVNACAQAFDRIGLPEGRYHLAHATLYLATAPKSNSAMAFFDALAVVEKEKNDEVPNHLKDASRDKNELGHGKGYLYPHAYRDHWVAQQYLPDSLQGRFFYMPSKQGYEEKIFDQVIRSREQQLAVYDEAQTGESIFEKVEETWIKRSFDNAAQRANIIRDEVFNLAKIAENDRVLDINTGSGLLSWEALRSLKTGSLSCVFEKEDAMQAFTALRAQSEELMQPHCFVASEGFARFFAEKFKAAHPFDLVIGRNFIPKASDAKPTLNALNTALAEGGRIVLVQALAREQAKIYAFAQNTRLAPKLLNAWREAEDLIRERMYAEASDEACITNAARELGLNIAVQRLELQAQLFISQQLFRRWFQKTHNTEKRSYIELLEDELGSEDCDAIVSWAQINLRSKQLAWPSQHMIVYLTRPLDSL
ncbi:MAG: AAA family ATPase [Bradymonadales bacterium]